MSDPARPAASSAMHPLAVVRVARRLRPHSYARGYANVKLRLDPAYRAVAETIDGSDLPVLDIGCGMGLLGMYLLERGICSDYLGIDSDPRKLRDGSAALSGAPASLRLQSGDATAPPPHRGHVVLLDVLHYLPVEARVQALREAAARVATTGSLIVRTCLADRSWRFHATRAEEWLLHASGWMRRDGTRCIPTRSQIEEPLRRYGMDVTSRTLWGSTPFNSYLFIARRRSTEVLP